MEVVLTFIISINREELVIFVISTQNKHSSHIRSAVQINSLAYKLMKTRQLPNAATHQLTNSRTR